MSATRMLTELPVDPRVATIRWTRCPVHGWRVGLDQNGRLVGRCPTCAVYAAQAQRVIERDR